MKRIVSLILMVLILVSMTAVGIIPSSAAVKVTDAAFSDNYVLLNFIQNTDGQYINTGYKAGADVTVSMDMKIVSWNGGWGTIFGSRNASHSSNSFVACEEENSKYLIYEIGDKTYYDKSVHEGTRCSISVNGTDAFTGEGLEMYLFGINQNGSFGTELPTAIVNIYSCKITDGGTVVRDYVPVKRKSDKSYGLFDLENGVFYPSASGKGFEKTATKTTDSEFYESYRQLEYIENTDGQYINTWYNAGTNVTVSMDLEVTSWNHTYSAIFGSRSSNHSANSFVMCRNNGSNGEVRSEIGNENYTYPPAGLNTRSELSLSGNDSFGGTGLEIYLFGLNENNKLEATYGAAVFKLYSCKITDDGEVVRDFVPAKRKADGVCGLFDLMDGAFYVSASGKHFESPTQKHDHIFNRDGFCTVCRQRISMEDYNSYSNPTPFTISFPGAKKIVMSMSSYKSLFTDGVLNLYDKNNQLVGQYGNSPLPGVRIIDGDTVRGEYNPPNYYDIDCVFNYIYPRYDDNIEAVMPTCENDGYSQYIYAGQIYDKVKMYAGHVYDKDGVCIHCNKKFVAADYTFYPDAFTYCEEQIKELYFPGADSISFMFHREKSATGSASLSAINFYDLGDGLHGFEEYEPSKGRLTVNDSGVRMNAFVAGRTGNELAMDFIIQLYTPYKPVDDNSITINSEHDFYAFRSNISLGTTYEGVTVNLNRDLDLKNVDLSRFTHSAGKEFCGTFNGNGHTIKGLTDTGGEYGGLFHVLGTGAVIKDLTLENVKISTTSNAGALASAAGKVTITNVNVTSGSVTGRESVAGLVGWFQSGATVSGCSNGATVSGGKLCGGIGGALDNDKDDWKYTVKNCSNSGSISASEQAGGIAGNLNTDNLKHDFSGCTNTGDIISNGDCAAGIVGRSEGGGNFTNCTNSGTIKAVQQAGGIVGWNEDDPIDFSNCKNSGTICGLRVSGTTYVPTNAGGIIGSFGGGGAYKFAKCINSGSVTGNCSAGGIVGWINNGASHDFTLSQNSGAITQYGQGSGAFASGGIVGVSKGCCNFSESTNTGTIHAYYSAGGIVGYVDTDSAQNCYKCTNKANVTADVNCAGGITGQTYGGGDYTYCTNNGNISGKLFAGGIFGWNEDDPINCSYSTNTGIISGLGTKGQIYAYSGGTVDTTGCVEGGSVASVLSSFRNEMKKYKADPVSYTTEKKHAILDAYEIVIQNDKVKAELEADEEIQAWIAEMKADVKAEKQTVTLDGIDVSLLKVNGEEPDWRYVLSAKTIDTPDEIKAKLGKNWKVLASEDISVLRMERITLKTKPAEGNFTFGFSGKDFAKYKDSESIVYHLTENGIEELKPVWDEEKQCFTVTADSYSPFVLAVNTDSTTSATDNEYTSPKTGDNNNPTLWFVLLALGGVAAFLTIKKKKKPVLAEEAKETE